MIVPSHVDKDPCSEIPDTWQLISVQPHGESFWATTGHIIVEADGSEKPFFVKLLSSDIGRRMVESEYESAKAISTVCPTFVPAAIGFGSLRGTPDVHFFIATFFEMGDQMPAIELFAKRLALLHQSDSPNGKFGFHLETYNGNLSQATQWEDSWEIFFAKSLRRALDHEIAAKGHDDEFATLIPQIFDVVIPRLLRPLESEGRRVRPVLVHGDLWYANSGVDANGQPVVFDACCFYAHNECRLCETPCHTSVLTELSGRRVWPVDARLQQIWAGLSRLLSLNDSKIGPGRGLRRSFGALQAVSRTRFL